MGEDIQCSEVICSRPADVAHTSVFVSGFKLSDTASYVCDEGYEVQSGNPSVVCLDTGEWSHLSLVCEPIECDHPNDIANAQVCHRVVIVDFDFQMLTLQNADEEPPFFPINFYHIYYYPFV